MKLTKIKKLITPLFVVSMAVLLYQGGWYLLNHEESGGKKLGEEIVRALDEFYHLSILTYAFMGLMASLVLRLLIKKRKKLIIVESVILAMVVILILIFA